MAWWLWVSVVLTWTAVASGCALWLGASAKAVRREEQAAHPWDDEAIEREWHDAA